MGSPHSSEIDGLFQRAILLVRRAPSASFSGPAHLLRPPPQVQLELYGLYKQPNLPSRPKLLQPYPQAPVGGLEPMHSALLPGMPPPILGRGLPLPLSMGHPPLRTLTWYLSPLSSSERQVAESALSECRELVERLGSQPQVRNLIGVPSPFEPSSKEDGASEFSFEEVFPSNRSDTLSLEENPLPGVLRPCQPVGNADPTTMRRRSYSTLSAESAELVPSVPFTPNFGSASSHGVSRRLSTASIPSLSLTSPQPRSRAHSNASQADHPLLWPRPRAGYSEAWDTPPFRDETSALIRSTSQRLGQGMALVRKTLQRLERLEERVDDALQRKLEPPSPRPSLTRLPSDASLSGWITKIYHTYLQ
ncbi:hypothetical protein L0F63_001839 [Massospora cicadina]|nr:hypothetical protein L0F63_001839 [Massospora cicadina]